LSRNGRFWVGTARIAPDTDVAYQVDFGSIVPVPGQGLNAGTLRRASGDALAGATVTLEVDGGQALGVVPYFVLSGMEVAAIVPFGEIFVGGALGYSTIGPLWSGSAVQFDVSIPNEIGLVDTVWIGQASFIDVAGVLPGAMVRLTNGLRFEVGAP
jgi:hypothetical protein